MSAVLGSNSTGRTIDGTHTISLQRRDDETNDVGLEPSVGFLHDFSDYQTRQSLVYDLGEPFRWLIDSTVVQAFESGALDVHDLARNLVPLFSGLTPLCACDGWQAEIGDASFRLSRG